MAIEVYLDEMLKRRGITGKELCAMVGITEANLSILRSGKGKGVRFHTLNKICYYLDCNVGDILNLTEFLMRRMNDETIHKPFGNTYGNCCAAVRLLTCAE